MELTVGQAGGRSTPGRSKHGDCIKQFNLKTNLKSLSLSVGIVLVGLYLTIAGWFGPYTSMVMALLLAGTLFFAVAPNCPGSICLRACQNGLAYRVGIISTLFLRWDQIQEFRTKKNRISESLVILVDESARVGKKIEFPLPFTVPVGEAAEQLTEIREANCAGAVDATDLNGDVDT